ncbi:Hypothetical predicted protein [Mytilus galloprovincialis]|uniref:Mab-21-like HhH/H2TH-like domain-containing protein n=1 Tax=Mytilus galloprovincialis TaxID=29158 RepID=A0A8B6EL33_MYTGA|nr:Hypothetical predicted protein [Mytilus galloprovincialis]
MNRKSRKDEIDNDQNVHGLRKITYWGKCGVKRFPYRGSHRFSPCVYQSEDGGIVISNDVFGLTIRQFERRYKACLERRKSQEQYILNLRYPDKTSDEYMEHLENSKYCQDYLSWTADDLKVRYLYENLVKTVGTEIDIRQRQQLFIIQDIIYNASLEKALTHISSGSLAEGLDLRGSDIDLMFVIDNVDVIQDLRNMRHPVQCTTLVMETDNDHPGFTRLRLIAGADVENDILTYEDFESTSKGLCLSVNKFVSNIKEIFQQQLSTHGPCLSDQGQHVDFAFCLRSRYLPYSTISWASRYRHQWPPNSTIDKIEQYGCLLVPIGPRTIPDCNILWRLSFSVAEKQLVHSFNFTQLLCYGLLKLTLKHIVNTNKEAEGLLCSYFLKTALFWVSEEVDIDTFQISKLFVCFSHCLDKLKLWVKKCNCPNYFIPEHNMFIGKINSDNNTILLNVLNGIRCDGIDGLTNQIFPYKNGSLRLQRKYSESSCFKLDFLFYRIFSVTYITDLSQCLKKLMIIESLIKSKYSTFIIDVCKYCHAEISQNAAQLLPPPSINTETYSIHKLYHRRLQDGTKADAVSGWLLYASFYYLTEQYNVTLRLTDYVLSRCSADMVVTHCANYSEEVMNNYRKHVHPTMTLNDKMRITTVSDVEYIKHSSLIPTELQLEVEDHNMSVAPTVMSQCLNFLCYHHLGDISNRQQALRDLYLTVINLNFTLSRILSNSITILGVCYEISGDKDTAYQYYDQALQFNGGICSSAEAGKSKLLEV